jgi:membrane-bound lytic murein transglycosylase MltF
MPCRSITRGLLAVLVALLLSAAPTHSQENDADRFTLPDFVTRPWTGDFDGMVERRIVRVLVPCSRTLYFVDRGTPRGLVHDVFRLYEEDLNKRLKAKHVRVHVFFVPVARDEIIPALLDGRGDIAAANLTVTPDRQALVDFTNPTSRDVSEIVVSAPGSAPLASAADLSGGVVYVRPSSSFHDSLEALNAALRDSGREPVKIKPAPEELEIEDLLEMVHAGLVPATVVDSHMAEFWHQVFPKLVLQPQAALRTGGQIAWMIRPESPKLKEELDGFLARHPEGSSLRNQLLHKYLKSTRYVKNATSQAERAKFERTVDFFRRYGDRYALDYLLVMAQGYQESRLDHNARSPVGAIGIMQVMPATGKELKVGDITQLEPNIHAGVKYMRFMMDQYYANEPMSPLNKGLFTFASYNAGPGRIRQMRRLAGQRGLDPNRWFNHVEVVTAEKVGRETVQYVSNIYKYYLAYRLVEEERRERDAARSALTGGQ